MRVHVARLNRVKTRYSERSTLLEFVGLPSPTPGTVCACAQFLPRYGSRPDFHNVRQCGLALCWPTSAFVSCIGFVILWALTGPVFGFSDTWQLIINTSTTIITFLMVFLIQNTQNRDNAALQAKLDELIRMSDADNSFIGIEHLTDKELEAILERCEGEARVLHEERRRRGKQILARAGAGSDLGKAAHALLDQEAKEQAAPRDTKRLAPPKRKAKARQGKAR